MVEAVYKASSGWPREETFGLTSQVRRAAVSIRPNLAEGQGRNSQKEFAHHVSIAHGSLCELETQLLIAKRLNHLDDTALDEQSAEVGRILQGLTRSLR